ncbi:MAG TPA: BON domain-containing protein [Polyangia bacterium]|nr:BON domain-containing protein [Polyangia bacterium]
MAKRITAWTLAAGIGLGGAAVATAATDHHAQLPSGDAAVTFQVRALLASHDPDAKDLEVDTDAGVVTLSGTVDSPYLRQRAVELARNAKGVKDVHDQITVQTTQ